MVAIDISEASPSSLKENSSSSSTLNSSSKSASSVTNTHTCTDNTTRTSSTPSLEQRHQRNHKEPLYSNHKTSQTHTRSNHHRPHYYSKLSNTATRKICKCRQSSSPSSSSSHKSTISWLKESVYQCIALIISLSSWIWIHFVFCFNRITDWMFPEEPEPIDMDTSFFFIGFAPIIFFVGQTWLPNFILWILGLRTSESGDRGKGNGMRRCWSTSLAFGLSFIKSYLRHSENLTIEEIQRRSRSIPFMTAPFGIKVHKAKVPVFPYRLKAETMVNECLTDEEKDLVYPHLKPYDNNNNNNDHDQSIETCENCGHRISDNVPLVMADPHREGLDVEWLESIGDDVETESGIPEDNYGVVIYFHGGGYYTGSKEEHRVLLGPLVKRLGKKIRVLNVGYRLAPQDPFPAALVDGISTYIWVLDQSISEVFGLDNYNSPEIGRNDRFQPNQVIVMGDSAGSGLALSLCLILRDHNTIPQPLSVVAWSPWVDLTQSLPSFDAHGITDCIPFGNFIHRYSPAIDMMFEDQQETGGKNGEDNEGRPVRQRAQVYCPDSCLRIKYVSPLFETDFRGITNVFITCGSAERFFDESVLLAVLLEEQQQPCRIDIHEEMPHIFQLFRYHPSSSAAIDRSSDYIREMINKNSSGIIGISSGSGRRRKSVSKTKEGGGDAIAISIAPSSSSSPRSSSPVIQGHGEEEEAEMLNKSSSSSSPTTLHSGCQSSASRHHRNPIKRPPTATRIRTIVNVIDQSGNLIDMIHYRRTDVKKKRKRILFAFNLRKRHHLHHHDHHNHNRHHHRYNLTLDDIVSDAEIREWKALLARGYIPTRHWPHKR